MKLLTFLVFVCISSEMTGQIQFHYCLYPQPAFDSDTCCWRQLADKNEFFDAGNLILEYMECHKEKKNSLSLYWHAGQMFACADRYDLAKKYFKKTYTVFTKWFGGEDGVAWFYYGRGTVAFLDKRKSRLNMIIHAWEKKLPKDLNYQSLVSLYSDFDSVYRIVLGK